MQDMVEFIKMGIQSMEIMTILETSPLEEIVLFLIAFMPAASYINNIYLRAQLGEVWGSNLSGVTSFHV